MCFLCVSICTLEDDTVKYFLPIPTPSPLYCPHPHPRLSVCFLLQSSPYYSLLLVLRVIFLHLAFCMLFFLFWDKGTVINKNTSLPLPLSPLPCHPLMHMCQFYLLPFYTTYVWCKVFNLGGRCWLYCGTPNHNLFKWIIIWILVSVGANILSKGTPILIVAFSR